ncbi:MAG: hypothetical protein J0M26_21325 [Planctomycetes bacterium]|nr:hypothetical protein [Planctomycetota bacterium]
MAQVAASEECRRMRTWILLAIGASIAGIVIGLLIPKSFSQLKISVPHGIFLLGALSQFAMPWIYPHERPNPQRDFNVGLSVFLIWFLFPLSAGINAWIYAIGVYDPIADDGYRYSIGYWWLGIISQIALGVGMTLWYLRDASLRTDEAWHPGLFGYVWVLQLLLWLAVGFGPDWVGFGDLTK